MESLGYCKGLKELSLKLGYDVVEYKKFKNNLTNSNPTAIIVIKKNNTLASTIKSDSIFACPKFKTPLIKNKIDNTFFSPEALSVYPIISDIPCLRKENSIFASKYND